MPEYKIEFTSDAREGFAALDKSEKVIVTKQLDKLKRAPELGAPLGRRDDLDLTGYRKLYAARKRVRIIYRIEAEVLVVTVVAIGPRENALVYRIADATTKKRPRAAT